MISEIRVLLSLAKHTGHHEVMEQYFIGSVGHGLITQTLTSCRVISATRLFQVSPPFYKLTRRRPSLHALSAFSRPNRKQQLGL